MTEAKNLSITPNGPGDGRYVRFFSQIGIGDVPLVGGKNASLGEMYQELTPHGIRVPNGFAVTAEAYRHTLDQAGAWTALHAALDGLDPDNVEDLARRAARAREIVYTFTPRRRRRRSRPIFAPRWRNSPPNMAES